MRKPRNTGTRRNPKYTGSVRYKGKDRWVKGSYPTVREWEDAAREVVEQLKAERPGADLTIRRYVGTKDEPGKWLKLNPRRKVISTEKLAEDIRPFVAKWGHAKFDDLDRLEVREWMSEQKVNTVKACRAMWNNARNDGATTASNPFSKPGIKEGGGRKNIQVLTEDEIELLMDIAKQHRPGLYGQLLSAHIAFSAYTGVRPGEAASLRWENLNLDEREANIWSTVDHKGREGDPKTVSGWRTVAIPERAVRELRAAPRMHQDLVFTSVQGHQITKSGWTYQWHSIRATFTAQLPKDHFLPVRIQKTVAAGENPSTVGEGKGYLHFYELRHFGLTRFLELSGWMNVMDVCLQAGHRNPELLYSTYGHPDGQKALARLKMLDDVSFTDAELQRLVSPE